VARAEADCRRALLKAQAAVTAVAALAERAEAFVAESAALQADVTASWGGLRELAAALAAAVADAAPALEALEGGAAALDDEEQAAAAALADRLTAAWTAAYPRVAGLYAAAVGELPAWAMPASTALPLALPTVAQPPAERAVVVARLTRAVDTLERLAGTLLTPVVAVASARSAAAATAVADARRLADRLAANVVAATAVRDAARAVVESWAERGAVVGEEPQLDAPSHEGEVAVGHWAAQAEMDFGHWVAVEVEAEVGRWAVPTAAGAEVEVDPTASPSAAVAADAVADVAADSA